MKLSEALQYLEWDYYAISKTRGCAIKKAKNGAIIYTTTKQAIKLNKKNMEDEWALLKEA